MSALVDLLLRYNSTGQISPAPAPAPTYYEPYVQPPTYYAPPPPAYYEPAPTDGLTDAQRSDILNSYSRLAASGDPAALQNYLATTPYTAAQLSAVTGYTTTDLQAALDRAAAAQPTAEQWTPATTIEQQGGITQVRGGDPGIGGYDPSIQYEAAKLGGFRGTYEDWAQQQAGYQTQALQELATNPNVVVGGYTPETQLSAVQNLQLPPETLPAPGGLLGSPATTAPTAPSTSVGGSPATTAPPSMSSGGGLVQDVNVNQYQPNPYLAQMGTVLTNRITDNLNRNIMPSIRGNAVMAGGFGGSRQGVVEANAMKDANQGISDALTGAYFQDFTNQMNRNLQQYGQNQNFYSNQRGQDLQQTALGANLFQQGNQGFLSQGSGIYGLGTQQQQAPWQVINNANAGLGQWSGYGTTTSANQGGGAQGALGGAMAGGQLGSLWGGAGINSPVSTPQPLNANYSLSTGGGLGLRWPS